MSEWTRYCEAGSCVEHRTVDGKVFLRNSSDEDRMLEFTAAEWDTFVAGLQPVMAAENARLRQQRDRALTAFESLEKTTAAALNQRDKAIAEAAVLRGRDRRTQAVVETAKALAAARGTLEPLKIAALTPVIDLLLAVDDLNEAKLCICRPTHRVDDPICQYVPEAPETAPASTLPAEQPQPVAQPTDGPEPQGEPQEILWFCPDCGRQFVSQDGLSEHHRSKHAVGYQNSGAIDTAALGKNAIKVHWGEPRVWNAGDPEPEGVEKVRSVRRNRIWTKNGDGKWSGERLTRSREWAAVVQVEGPLTEVLPEPTTANRYLVGEKGPVMLSKPVDSEVFADTKPDGEVPEAGRAGEAQTKDQDRTEVGVDAAIEAAEKAYLDSLTYEPYVSRRDLATAMVRAASPPIERAALNAAASELAGGTGTMWYGEPPPYLVEVCANWLRDRATRTETP